MTTRNVLLLTLMTLLISSCSYIGRTTNSLQSRDNEYLTAKNAPPLRIPPGMSSNSFDNYHPIPDRTYPESSKVVNLMPPGMTTKN